MLLSPMWTFVEMTSLGGLRCQVYTGSLNELASTRKFLDQEGRTWLSEAVGNQWSCIDVISPTIPEWRKIGNERNMKVQISPTDPNNFESECISAESLMLKPGHPFFVKWGNADLDLSDDRTRQRLLTYFRWKFGGGNYCELSQLGDLVRVDLTRGCASLLSLRRCLGLHG